MKILVCIKQVPSSKEIVFYESTAMMKRNPNEVMINPSDFYALETAFKVKEQLGGEVTVLTMGPSSAKEALKEALSLGADKAILVSDEVFKGSDLLATSYTLAESIRKIGKFDLIICGRESLDGSTGQLPGEIAEQLQLPIIYSVSELLNISEESLEVNSIMEEFEERVKGNLPLVLTVKENIFEPRFPNYIDLLRSEKEEIQLIQFDDLEDQNKENYGFNGSASLVKRVFDKPFDGNEIPDFNLLNNKEKNQVVEGNTEDLVSEITNKLKTLKFI